MGVYSPGMLLHFPEQFRDFTYFDMIPNINSGYTLNGGPPAIYSGVLQNDVSQVMDSNGHLVDSTHENLWTDSVLQKGHYVLFEGVTYRIVFANDWSNEGGFYNYSLQRLVGDNGTPNTTNWTTGIGATQV